MNRSSDRIQLVELSIDSFKNYVGEVCVMLLDKYKSKELDETIIVSKNVCNKIRNLFHETPLPTSIADEITCDLLKEIMSKFSCHNFETWSPEIFVQLADSVMHPRASKLILETDTAHNQFFSMFRMGIIPLIVPNLETRPNIRVLRLGHMRRKMDFSWPYYPKQLQELTIEGYLNDQRLEFVVESCKQLRMLNITNSEDITDGSIQNILKLKLLQALYITGTHITDKGIEQLLLGLSENERNRSSELPFKCISGLCDPNIKTLVENFPNICEVSVFSSSDYLLLNLSELKNLRSLKLQPYYNNDPPDGAVLNSFGRQLTCLHLENFDKVDIKTIGENCLTLKCLHISTYETEITEEDAPNVQISGFLSVECLCLNMPDDELATIFLISQCHNLKRLYVNLDHITFRELIDAVSYNKMEFLETLYVTPWHSLTQKYANFLAEKYKRLRVAYGSSSNVKNANGVRFLHW